MPAQAHGLRTALDMAEAGVVMYRQRMKREHPDATTDQIETLVTQWRVTRPGAAFGDTVGRPSKRFT